MRKWIQNRKLSARNAVLNNFTLSYAILLIVPIVMGTFHYKHIIDTSFEQISYSHQLILENAKNSFQNSLDSILTFTDILNELSSLDEVLEKSDINDLPITVLQRISKELPWLTDSNHYVKSYYIYSEKNTGMLQPNRVYLNPQLYYNMAFGVDSYNYEEWRSAILEPKTGGPLFINFKIQEEYRTFYSVPYFNKSTGQVTARVVFEIDRTRLEQELSPGFSLGARYICALDSTGVFLTAAAADGTDIPSQFAFLHPENGYAQSEMEVDGETMIVSFVRSNSAGCIYMIITPKSVFLSEAAKSLRVTFAVLFTLTASGILVIILSFLYNRRPLLDLLKELQLPEESQTRFQHGIRNGLWFVSHSVAALVQDKVTLENRLNEQRQRLKNAFLVQMVYAGFPDGERTLQTAQEYGLKLEAHAFRGLYLRIASGGQADLVSGERQHKISLQAASYSDCLLPCFWSDEVNLTLLYRNTSQEKESCEALLQNLYFKIKNKTGMEVVFFLGPRVESLSDLPASFSEARKLMVSEKEIFSRILVSNDETCAEYDRYEYTLHQESRLLEHLSAGDFERISKLLDKIYEVNFIKRNLSASMRDMLLNRMAGTIIGSQWGADMYQRLLPFTELHTQEFFRRLKEAYRSVCENQNARKKAEYMRTQKNLIEYINENYSDYSLSLSNLSSRFGMTESYLSTLIKQLVGQNFSSYLEKLRIRRANELLKNHKLSIAEIGQAVGYDNSTSFGRAYKRVTGVSPSQYAKIHYQTAKTDNPLYLNDEDL